MRSKSRAICSSFTSAVMTSTFASPRSRAWASMKCRCPLEFETAVMRLAG